MTAKTCHQVWVRINKSDSVMMMMMMMRTHIAAQKLAKFQQTEVVVRLHYCLTVSIAKFND